MAPLHAFRIAPFAMGLAVLSACSTGGGQPPAVSQPAGTEAAYCPPVVQREGTSVLRRGEGDALQYVASISQTSRSCRVIDGVLHIEVGIAGRVMPGAAAPSGQVGLPLRVVVVRGSEVLYSNLGRIGVPISQGSGAQPFTYVDRAIRLSEPASRQVNIQVGFDEQN